MLSIRFRCTKSTSTKIDLKRRKNQTRNRQLVRIGSDKFFNSDTIIESAVLFTMFLDRNARDGFTVFRIVVTNIQLVVITKSEDLLGRFEESLGAATGEVSASISHFGVEDGVTNKDHLLFIEDVRIAGGSVTRSVDGADLELADGEGVAFREELVELSTVLGGVVGDVEDGDPVVENLDDVGADADGRSSLGVLVNEFFLEVVRRSQVISMNVRFKDHDDIQTEFFDFLENSISRSGCPTRRLDIIIKKRIDDTSILGFLAPENVGKSTSFFFVEVFDVGHCILFLFCFEVKER